VTRRRAAFLSAPPRWLAYSLMGAALALGAPLGLLAVRLGPGGLSMDAVRGELQADRETYVYVAVSTVLVFASFGFVLGRQADALVALSKTDPLTRLGNLLAIEDRLELENARAARYNEPLSLLLLDVDGLKTINDRHGHRAGNRALQAVARALRSGARAADLPARVGGDEFALLAPTTPADAALALGERIRMLVADEGVYGLTVSVGVATLDGTRLSDAGRLWDRADAGLYEAKRQGRNRVLAV
jgi:diguanylate cyclase (GGDEF)-like protein